MNRYSEISGGEDNSGDYKKAIEIISTGNIDWKEVCIEIAKSHPRIFVESVRRNNAKPVSWEQQVKKQANSKHDKINAIKLCRSLSGMDLAEAKYWVEKNCDVFKR